METGLAVSPVACDGLVEKQIFSMPSYTTLGGKIIRDLKIGYETYGSLNAAGDNAILITHYFSGTSHAAGRYRAEDTEAGYWDAIIGAGKAIDTDKYFVIGADSLVNLSANAVNTITTGPASINPETGKPYGMSFPVVTIADFVNVQKALLDALGVVHLHAVAGPSMGAMQALEWAAAYPDMVARVVAVIPPGLETCDYLIGMLNSWVAPVRLDVNWHGGDYYGKAPPLDGLAVAIKLITLNGRHFGWADSTFGRKSRASRALLLEDFNRQFVFEEALDQLAAERAPAVDANSLLYMVKACQLYSLGHGASLTNAIAAIKAKLMLVPATSDLLMFPDYARKAAHILRANGKQVDYLEIKGEGGHFDGLQAIDQLQKPLREFLEN